MSSFTIYNASQTVNVNKALSVLPLNSVSVNRPYHLLLGLEDVHASLSQVEVGFASCVDAFDLEERCAFVLVSQASLVSGKNRLYVQTDEKNKQNKIKLRMCDSLSDCRLNIISLPFLNNLPLLNKSPLVISNAFPV